MRSFQMIHSFCVISEVLRAKVAFNYMKKVYNPSIYVPDKVCDILLLFYHQIFISFLDDTFKHETLNCTFNYCNDYNTYK